MFFYISFTDNRVIMKMNKRIEMLQYNLRIVFDIYI